MKGDGGDQTGVERLRFIFVENSGACRPALIGFVSDAGTRTLHVRIVDLDTGEPIWMGKARDDVEWQWIYAQRDIGEMHWAI